MSSNKPLADSVGYVEYVLLGLTFLGVLYLVLKTAKIKIEQSEGLVQSAGLLGFNTVTDSSTHRGSNRDGMGGSLGSFEPPVFHMTPYDPEQLAGAYWNIADDSDPDFVAMHSADDVVARRRASQAAEAAASKYATKFNMGTVDGMRTAGYGKANYNGMSNSSLSKAMAGL